MTDAAETAADAVECPLCGVAYPRARIEAHAATCDGTASPQPRAEKRPKTADGDAEDADYQLALRLQAELDAEASQAYTCGLCHHTVPVANLYILDVCLLECFSSFLELPFFHNSFTTHNSQPHKTNHPSQHPHRNVRTNSAEIASEGTWQRRWRRG